MGERSRERILAAAREEFGLRGFAGARTQRIAEGAGVNKQLLFYYFGSKRGLYEAVLQEAGATLAPDGAQAGRDRGPDGVRTRLRGILERAFTHPKLGVVLARGALASDPSDAARRATANLVGEVRAAILAGQAIGFFRDDADPDLAAEQAVVMVLGYLAIESALPDGSTRDRDAWVTGVTELLVRGLTW